jgi:deaminated glutathione amidase
VTPVFRAGCLQLTPGNVLSDNLAEVSRVVAAAARDGVQLAALPEFTTYLDRDSRSMRSSATTQAQSNALLTLRHLAAEHGVWMLVGSLVMLAEGNPSGKLSNRSFLLDDKGAVVATYDKIHLFDAQLSDGRTVGESRHYIGGDQAVVADTPLGQIGMSVCYDLRFPSLYRTLALAGAQLLMVPSAFTAETGEMHWEPLLRARAIETGCFVLAPATCGVHPGGWHTYGHASIVDPYGKILAGCGRGTGTFCAADIDLELCSQAQARIPSLQTNPPYSVVKLQR